MRIGEERRHRRRQLAGVGYGFGCASGIQLRRHSGAITDIRPVQDGAVEPGRLERIVAALGNERTADKGDPSDSIEEPEFTHRIGEIDVGPPGYRLAVSASGGP